MIRMLMDMAAQFNIIVRKVTFRTKFKNVLGLTSSFL
jgi:hypothetical protein